MSYSLFGDAASTPGNDVVISVPYLLSAVTHVDGRATQIVVANDGYLVGFTPGAPEPVPAVVTAWTPGGQGSGKGRPESWRQTYRREFSHDDAAKRRFDAVVAKHGGPNTARPVENSKAGA